MQPVRYTMYLYVSASACTCGWQAGSQRDPTSAFQLWCSAADSCATNTLLWITARAFYLGHILCFSGPTEGISVNCNEYLQLDTAHFLCALREVAAVRVGVVSRVRVH